MLVSTAQQSELAIHIHIHIHIHIAPLFSISYHSGPAEHRAEFPVPYSRFSLVSSSTHTSHIYVNPNLPVRWSNGCGNLISGSSAFSKSSLNIWKFTVHILLKPQLENFEHYFANVWDECNCAVVQTFFGIAFLWDWNENWPFPVLWPLLSFPNLLACWVQHFHSIISQDLK